MAANLDAQGQAMKSVAAVVAGILLIVALGAAAQLRGNMAVGAFLACAIAAAITGATIYSHGVRIAAEGQQLLAALDVAVHTSPFLSDEERARAMSL